MQRRAGRGVVVVVVVVVAAVVFPWSDSTSPESVLVPEFHPVTFSFLPNEIVPVGCFSTRCCHSCQQGSGEPQLSQCQ